ncbi:dynein axonemal assembly factor 4 [Scleropages formosus]|uniref:dynein axonemal assembly factor 4 n=1 Tax=Scleropages formosus TaxID=113540 RepID=UPI0008790158|nr:dynein assembly factor 4, axonemal [Scleropages formosus]
MPLIVKDFTWTQTQSLVYISVPLKGIKVGQGDILATDEYLKVTFSPFLFEVFLFEHIDDDKSVARISKGVLVFTLHKKDERMWEQLTIKDADPQIMKAIRERAVIKVQEKCNMESKAKAVKKQEENKYALETMMKMEEEERARIEKVKAEECNKATAELEAWKLKQKQEAQVQEAQRICQMPKLEEEKKNREINHKSAAPQKHKEQQTDSSKKKQVRLPAPRSSGTIKIQFTPRVFPTALRESRVAEEEEWLKKQAEARRAVSDDVPELKDLKEDERNPEWLKEKGNKLFATGNYAGAVNAYNLAIKLNRNLPSLYLNRAACHLKLRNLHKAIEDSSRALDLLMPAVADNADSRMKAHVRRGTAFCELELYVEGLQDYQAALKIDPHNKAVLCDAEKIRQIIQGNLPNPSAVEKKM